MFGGIRALIFDLDGTLVDSVPDLADAVDAMLADLQRAPVGEARVREWVGNGARSLVKRALTGRMDDEPEPALFEQAIERFYLRYGENVSERSRVYPGVAEALARLHAAGFGLAVVTNKPARFIAPLLSALEIGRYFSVLIGGDTLEQRKPHPAPLLHAARLLGKPAQAVLMVGDSRNDIEAARRAGMAAIGVPYGYNYGEHIQQADPDRVIDDLRELLSLLQQAA